VQVAQPLLRRQRSGDHGSKPAWANSSERPYLKKPFTKTGLVEWLKALSLNPSTAKKKKASCLWLTPAVLTT
jgi:hypothetical protein